MSGSTTAGGATSPAADPAAYPFPTREVALTAGRMRYSAEGEGPPILFVHGTPTWSFDWRRLIATFRSRFRCVAPDLLGFGRSERPRGFAYTPEAHAVALAEFVDRLRLHDFTLVVHDFGGPIGLPLAVRDASPVKRLVVMNSWMWSLTGDPFYENGARVAKSALGRFLYRRVNLSLRVITPGAYADRRKLTPAIHRQLLDRFPDPASRGLVLWPLAKALLDSSAHYDALWQRRERLRGLPALIVWGMKDPAFPPRLLAKWREALPQARVVELAQSGHWPHEEEPEAVVAALEEFLATKA
jgi:haloalkane dehalogenase